MMALRRLTENDDEFNREIVVLILPQGYPFSPTDPNQASKITIRVLFIVQARLAKIPKINSLVCTKIGPHTPFQLQNSEQKARFLLNFY